MNDLCEVRVTTYRRPGWLRHALETLLAQTHRHWRALIFDDSPDREGEAVVQALGDARLIYSPNAQQLGCTRNLNRAFQTAAYQGGAYACILEDDNWFYPEFLAQNITVLQNTGTKIVQRNQDVWSRYSEPPQRTDADCLGHWYGGDDQVLEPLRLHAFMFLFPGVSNGALFWNTTAASDLQVDEGIRDASLQEYGRCAQIQERVVFAGESLAAWADVPKGQAARGGLFRPGIREIFAAFAPSTLRALRRGNRAGSAGGRATDRHGRRSEPSSAQRADIRCRQHMFRQGDIG